MGTKANPGQFDCYNAAKLNEPIFVLLGRDRHASTLVRLWALLRHRDIENERVGDEDTEKVEEALQCAKAIDDYCKGLGKFSDYPESLYIAATEGMISHPEGFDCSCDCDLCKSYA